MSTSRGMIYATCLEKSSMEATSQTTWTGAAAQHIYRFVFLEKADDNSNDIMVWCWLLACNSADCPGKVRCSASRFTSQVGLDVHCVGAN